MTIWPATVTGAASAGISARWPRGEVTTGAMKIAGIGATGPGGGRCGWAARRPT